MFSFISHPRNPHRRLAFEAMEPRILLSHNPNSPPDHGGGGGDGGGDVITNPAFVFLQNGKKGGGTSVNDLYLTTADGSSTVRLTDTDSFLHTSPNWSPDGSRIAFIRQEDCGRLCLGPDQLYTIQADGTGLTLVHDFGASGEPGPAHNFRDRFAWSPGGTQIVYATGSFVPEGFPDLLVVDVASGTVTPLIGDLFDKTDNPSFSPDLDADTAGYQGKIVFAGFIDRDVTVRNDIFILDVVIDGGTIQTGGFTQLTEGPGDGLNPAWSPDGQFIAYHNDFDIKLLSVEASGTGLDVTVTVTGTQVLVTPAMLDVDLIDNGALTWSPDSQWLGFQSVTSGGDAKRDLYRIQPDGTDLTNVTVTDKKWEHTPDWNPDWVNDLAPAAASSSLLALAFENSTGDTSSSDGGSGDTSPLLVEETTAVDYAPPTGNQRTRARAVDSVMTSFGGESGSAADTSFEFDGIGDDLLEDLAFAQL